MLTKTILVASAVLIAGSITAASAQTVSAQAYEPDGSFQSTWTAPKPTPAFRQPRQAAARYNRNAVYENGKYIGQDPDPNVRMMMEKDYDFDE